MYVDDLCASFENQIRFPNIYEAPGLGVYPLKSAAKQYWVCFNFPSLWYNLCVALNRMALPTMTT